MTSFSHNGANGPELKTTHMFHPVRQVAAPGTKSAVCDCRRFFIEYRRPFNYRIYTSALKRTPRVGPGYPLSAFAPPLSIAFLVFCSLLLFLVSFSHSLYLFSSRLLSIRSLSTRIVSLRFQARGCSRRPNLGLVCFFFVYDCVICIA